MAWWVWLIIILTAVFLIVDWFIIMGIDPRSWKGGGKDGKREGDFHKGPDRKV